MNMQEIDREVLGRRVRDVWISWAQTQQCPKVSWLTEWDEMDERDREVDRQIGETIAMETDSDLRAENTALKTATIEYARAADVARVEIERLTKERDNLASFRRTAIDAVAIMHNENLIGGFPTVDQREIEALRQRFAEAIEARENESRDADNLRREVRVTKTQLMEARQRLNTAQPTCPYCRGEIGVVLTTLGDQGKLTAERDQLRAALAKAEDINECYHARLNEVYKELAKERAEVERLKNWREFVGNNARPGDVANVILDRDDLRRQFEEEKQHHAGCLENRTKWQLEAQSHRTQLTQWQAVAEKMWEALEKITRADYLQTAHDIAHDAMVISIDPPAALLEILEAAWKEGTQYHANIPISLEAAWLASDTRAKLTGGHP